MQESIEIARDYEDRAKTAKNKSDMISNYSKAISIYRNLGYTSEEIRCLKDLSKRVEDTEKIEYLLESWKAQIKEIVVYKYETSYEWKGEEANLNDDYNQVITKKVSAATDTIKEILSIPTVNREKILEVLAAECVKRNNEGGWGSEECWKSIEHAWKR